MNDIIDHFDKAGRPAMRILGVLICSVIGIAICAAFVNWGFFHRSIPDVPLSNLAMAAVPYAYQIWDNHIRQTGRNLQLGLAMPVNPHGGPNAP